MSDSYKKVVKYCDEVQIYNACGIISLGKENYPSFERKDINERFYNYFNEMLELGIISNFYFIYHNENVSNPHIHYGMNLCQKTRITAFCNKIAHFCNVNTLAISIDKLVYLNGLLNYFIHDDEVDKFQYQIDDIITNQSKDVLYSYFEKIEDTNRIDYYINLCLESKNKINIMRVIGLKEYHKYRYEINEIWEYVQANRYVLQENKQLSEDTPF